MGALLIVLFMLGLMAGLVWLGVHLAEGAMEEDKGELDTQRLVLDAEWTALEQTRRVNDVFFRARDAMRQAEADAHERRPRL
jgi:hypothetical protein